MLNSNELINKVKVYNKFLNHERLDKAYNFAIKAHQNQKRASGDPYSVHPIEVANILTELKLDSATITTGLLHDTIEDTVATYETIKNEFGPEVADLVDGVTKISVFENTASFNSKAENFRKLILATSKDIRVLLVKIADRLHNMRTIKAITKEDKRKRIAQETMEIYAPLADRMGMHRIRDELEDLSFEILNNDARSLIQNRLDEIKLDKNDVFENLSSEFIKLLNEGKVPAPYNKKGFGGMKITAIPIDESGGATKQVQEFRNLVQRDKVDAVLGYVSSGDCMAIPSVADELKALTVLYDCGTPRVFEEKKYKYVFRTAAHAAMDNIAIAKYLIEKGYDISSIAGINQNYAWGKDSWKDFSVSVKKLSPSSEIKNELFPKIFSGQYGTEISALMNSKAKDVHSCLLYTSDAADE